ncbi:hypothetical protein M422DRAFT_187434 [Sphaerobolus stellatus SS14]|uniref:Prenylcysteine lyase domain-containing protein n=1 Tax=Sphaerobolus stellatus (strain SS14) TaxID=990650 RepID=A0A0C9UXQ8_SPHS4|nr:hypothetical protein M422DRAFT_187434 [Sphaerobolus stellatus SS14]
MLPLSLFGLLLLLPYSYGLNFPFSLPFASKHRAQVPIEAPAPFVKSPHKVAIIGAGAGGSSAAYWLARAQNRTPEHELEVEIFEKEGYIGGRSTVVFPYSSEEYRPIELGASIFVKANRNLWRAAQEFNLSFAEYDGEDGEFAIWDGSEFRFRMTNGSFSWWDTARLLWRYGINAPRRSQALVDEIVKEYMRLYNPLTPDWTDVSDISAFLNFSNFTSGTTAAYLKSQGIDEKYIVEMVESMTRVNYGQNVDGIHALEGMVSQAANGAASVAGGNYQLFEQFVLRSKAKIHLNTTVKSLSQSNKKWTLKTSDGSTKTFDSVILAAPFHSTGISITPALPSRIPKQPYVHLHVTLLSTPYHQPNPTYFNLKEGSSAPQIVLTTNDGFIRGGPAPEFNSMTYHGRAGGTGEAKDENVVKIFSADKIEDEWLEKTFGTVGWVYRKEWDAYPVLPPTEAFPPVMPTESLYYVNSFEPFISTMETETISSLNTVRLLLQNVFGVNSTICEVPESEEAEEILKGWDC